MSALPRLCYPIGDAILNINGRKKYVGRVKSVSPAGPGKWRVSTNHLGMFTIIGGKKAGGASNEWWVESDDKSIFNSHITCSSMQECIRMIEGV